MKSFIGILILGSVLLSCSESFEEPLSSNEFFEFFYPYDTIPKVYVYRNVTNGLEEEFHRVFSLNDSEGKHIVVEKYANDGRILEALNYNVDSLTIIDHMVVGRDQTKNPGTLDRKFRRLIPEDRKSVARFSSVFPGLSDSTLFLQEVTREFSKEEQIAVMGKKEPGIVFKDEIKMTLFNPWTKQEGTQGVEMESRFAKGYGLVEWWDTPQKMAHFRLEKIISQEDFVNIMSK